MIVKNTDKLCEVMLEFGLEPFEGDEIELPDAAAEWIEGAHSQQQHVEHEHRHAIGIARYLSHKRNQEIKAAPIVSVDTPIEGAVQVQRQDSDAVWRAQVVDLLTQLCANTTPAAPASSSRGGVILPSLVVLALLVVLTIVAIIK